MLSLIIHFVKSDKIQTIYTKLKQFFKKIKKKGKRKLISKYNAQYV